MKIGIIGGSGLEKLDLFKNAESIEVNTVYGSLSSPILKGDIGKHQVYFVSRHGFEHTITPSQVNNRAHILALKELGCEIIIATTACGSLREDIKPGHLVFPNQIIDFTRFRKNTFFDSFKPGEFNHTPFADPFNEKLIQKFSALAQQSIIPYHVQKTLITIEGPRFSSRAESHMFRAWGADIINMSTAPEVILANELSIPYVAIAMSTDYDCWRENEETVTAEAVLETFRENARNVTDLLVAYLND
ncbi:MAG: 5'-methylthioadenosine phosphorylase [Bacteroidetes bacterium 4572_77]|nr:MAG: 5'-methylthioadenosine phosphorylase [Bacteroidetes bacterium 4572_77]